MGAIIFWFILILSGIFLILCALLPFAALFFTLNIMVFDTANLFRRIRKLPPRPKPWVFQTKKDANIAWVIAGLAMLAFQESSKLGWQLIRQFGHDIARWFT